jgi:hypothetical protein
MRRLIPALACAALAACSTSRPAPLPEASPELVSDLKVADPSSAVQLAGGFEPAEQPSWRWTNRRFRVVLKAPPGAAERGAKLRFEFTVPDPEIASLHESAISAAVNGLALAPLPLRQAGEYAYEREVPAEAFRAGNVLVEFTLEKAFEPPGDGRSLGVVAARVALLPHS